MKPFWENEYLNKERSTFGNPSKEVEDIVSFLPEKAKILDVGCVDGRHSLYLAGLAMDSWVCAFVAGICSYGEFFSTNNRTYFC